MRSARRPRRGCACRAKPARLQRWSLLLATAAVALSGCGGGGGGANPGSRPPRLSEAEEFSASYALEAIRAAPAYAAGAAGQGVRVAVIDTGVDVDHPEFRGALAAASTNIVSGSREFLDDADGHGTAVAGVLGARRDGALMHGVAFESEILAIRADNGAACDPGCGFGAGAVARATDHAIEHRARVINYSLGTSAGLSDTLAAALARATDAGAILVFAAGNEGGAEPVFPARFATDPRVDGQAIAVGAVDAQNRLASFSNRAGAARAAFLVAPGVGLLAPQPGGGAGHVNGTSFATPHVAGAAAVVLGAAPFLEPSEVVDILLDSATDLGEPGEDAVFGRGLLNLEAALRPLGAARVPLGASVADDAVPLAGSGFVAGGALGPGPRLGEVMFLDAYGRPYGFDLDRQVRAREDGFDLLHSLSAGQQVRRVEMRAGAGLALTLDVADAGPEPQAVAAGTPSSETKAALLGARLGPSSEVVIARQHGLGAQFGLARLAPEPASTLLSAEMGIASPYLALAAGGDALVINQALGGGFALSFGAGRTLQESDSSILRPKRLSAAVVELSRTDPSGPAIGLQVGRLLEDEGVLGSRSGGALALDAATTTFFGLAGRLPLDERFDVFGQLSYGASAAEPSRRALIDDFSTLHGMSFSAGVAARAVLTRGDELTLMAAQPLRVFDGAASIDRPLARSFDGEILRAREAVDLAPQGRELDFEAAYRLRLTSRFALHLNWLARLEPGHDPDQRPEHAVSVRLQSGF